jgi:hypothetical protein
LVADKSGPSNLSDDTRSTMVGRTVTYADRVTPVHLGDHVETRIWWRRRAGRVVYVPGVSPFNATMEYNGLAWVGIRLDGDAGFVSTVVDPIGAFLIKKERLVRRDPADVPVLRDDEDVSSDTFPSP